MTPMLKDLPMTYSPGGLAIASAFIAGFLSWVLLNRYTIRGDYAVVVYAIGSSVLYNYAIRGLSSDSPFLLTAVLSSIYVTSLSLFTVTYRLSPFHPLAAFPGPVTWRISSIVLAVVSYKGKRHYILDDLHKKYGKFVRIGPNALSINSSTASNIIYGATHHMGKSDSYAKPGHVGGVALFFKQDREDHAKRKKIWTNAFTASAVEDFFPPLEKRTWQLTRCIENRTDHNSVVDLGQCFEHWSYDFMGEMVFGGCNNLELMRNGDPDRLVAGGKMATIIVDSIGQTPWLMDILWHIPASKAIHQLRHVAASMMRVRVRAAEVAIRDLSSYLIEGDRHTGEKIPMSDLEIDALIAIQAGSDNTASSMTLSLYFMLAHPPTYQLLQAELDKAFPDATEDLDNKKLARIPLLDGVIHESLRLGTPFFIPRIVPDGGVTIDEELIPGGSIVASAAYSQQVSEENFFPDPLAYRPERWLPGGLGDNSILNKSAMSPFSSGPAVCVAKSFAIQEMRLVIARLMLTFDMSFAPSFDAKAFHEGFRNMRTTVLDKPLLVKAVRRVQKTLRKT